MTQRSHTSRYTLIRIILLFLVIQIISTGAKGQMRQIYVDNTTNNIISKISFYSASEGYVAFRDWIGYTTDSGRTFIQKYITANNVNFGSYSVNLLFGFGVAGVKAFNQSTIIVYGDYGLVPAILYSSNGGNSFTLVYHSQFNSQQLTGGITDIIFPQNTNIGFAVDADRILKTVDGGITWGVSRTFPGYFFTNLEAVDNNNVIALHTGYNSNGLVKTASGGTLWQVVFLPILPTGKMSYAWFRTMDKGWLSMYDSNHNDYFYTTTNGGVNWTLQNNIEATPFRCGKMKFFDDNTGYALSEQNTVHKTEDGGKTWEPLPRDNDYVYLGYSHNDLHFWNSNQFWAGGGHGFLEITTNGGGTTLPKAYFRVDTTGVAATGNVSLLNYSKTGYTYNWYRNDTLVGTSYNVVCSHYLYSSVDSIKLVVSNGTFSDTTVKYSYFNAPPPPPVSTITSFAPASGFTTSMITITGTNFTGATVVKFGSVPATSFTIVSATTIKALVGQGETGNISVTTPLNTASKPGFTYTTRLKITSFTPVSAAIGSPVTINGTNFSPVPAENFVFFGPVRATVTAATTTQLVVTVPTGATHEPISVSVNGLTAYSSFVFLPRFTGDGVINSNLFTTRIDSAADPGAKKITAADLDGDGKTDIITAGDNYNRFSVLRNTSSINSISFAQKKTFEIVPGYGGKANLLAGDINGDGKPDVTVPDAGGFSVYKNTSTPGTISFAPKINMTNTYVIQPDNLGMADFNGDGKPEIFGTDLGIKVVFFKNTSEGGNISFTLGIPIQMQWYYNGDCKAIDVDGDGRKDIVVTNYDGNGDVMMVYRNTSVNDSISFATTYPYPSIPILSHYAKLCTADFDGDGKLDIAATSWGSSTDGTKVSVLRNTSVPGSVSFAPRVDFTVSNEARSVGTDDLDGDGKPDIIMDNYQTSMVSVLKNTSTAGTISFLPKVDFGPNGCYDMTLNDIDGDGKPDVTGLTLFGTPPNYNTVSVFQNKSQGTITNLCAGATTSLTSNLTGTSYRWQRNSGAGFTNISDGGNYSGTTTAVLQLTSIPSSFYGSQFRCMVDSVNYSNIKEIRFRNTWTGAVSAQWENAANWSCGFVPDMNTDVTIGSGTIILNSNTTIRTLTLSPGVILTVTPGYNLVVTN